MSPKLPPPNHDKPYPAAWSSVPQEAKAPNPPNAFILASSKPQELRPCENARGDTTSETAALSQASDAQGKCVQVKMDAAKQAELDNMSTVATDGSDNDYGPIRKQRERSVSVTPIPEVIQYETDNPLNRRTPRKKRAGEELPDLGVSVNQMKEMVSDPHLLHYFEHCMQHVKEGLASGKYHDETSAYAALVIEMDQRFAEDPNLSERKRCLAAVMAYLGQKGDTRVGDLRA